MLDKVITCVVCQCCCCCCNNRRLPKICIARALGLVAHWSPGICSLGYPNAVNLLRQKNLRQLRRERIASVHGTRRRYETLNEVLKVIEVGTTGTGIGTGPWGVSDPEATTASRLGILPYCQCQCGCRCTSHECGEGYSVFLFFLLFYLVLVDWLVVGCLVSDVVVSWFLFFDALFSVYCIVLQDRSTLCVTFVQFKLRTKSFKISFNLDPFITLCAIHVRWADRLIG